MITIFAVPKPFRGEAAALQTRALANWAALASDVEVLLFGDEDGVAAAAAASGARHVATLARNAAGTPLLSDAFAQAARLARGDLLLYSNGDLLFVSGVPAALQTVAARWPFFVAVGACLDVPVTGAIDWRNAAAVAAFDRDAHRQGQRRGDNYIDWFAFPRAAVPVLPDFAVGRAGWDNWLCYEARRRGPLVDVGAAVTVVHQHHGYDHLAGGRREAYEGAEAARNRALAGNRHFTIANASHRLRADGRMVTNWRDRPLRAWRSGQRAWWLGVAAATRLLRPLRRRARNRGATPW